MIPKRSIFPADRRRRRRLRHEGAAGGGPFADGRNTVEHRATHRTLSPKMSVQPQMQTPTTKGMPTIEYQRGTIRIVELLEADLASDDVDGDGRDVAVRTTMVIHGLILLLCKQTTVHTQTLNLYIYIPSVLYRLLTFFFSIRAISDCTPRGGA